MKLRLNIEFHTPFRVATGVATDTAAVGVDRREPLPTASLKGVMRASANRLLPNPDLIAAVFGAPGGRAPSPWHWGTVVFPAQPQVDSRVRIALDQETHVVRPEYLARTEEVWADEATYVISQRAPLTEQRLREHSLVLRVAAAGVHALGASRRRGLGWVTISPDPPLDDDDFALLDRLIGEEPA